MAVSGFIRFAYRLRPLIPVLEHIGVFGINSVIVLFNHLSEELLKLSLT